MKIKYIGETIPLELTKNKTYDVVSVEKGWYRIIIDEPISEDYIYPPELFEIVEEGENSTIKKRIYGVSPTVNKKSAVNIAIAGK